MSLTGRIKESIAVVTDPFVDVSEAVAGCVIHLRSISLGLDSVHFEVSSLSRLLRDGNDRLGAIHATIGQFRQPVMQMAESMSPARQEESVELLSGIKNAITNIAGALDAERRKRKAGNSGAEIVRILTESRSVATARHAGGKEREDLRHAELMQLLGRICDKIEGSK